MAGGLTAMWRGLFAGACAAAATACGGGPTASVAPSIPQTPPSLAPTTLPDPLSPARNPSPVLSDFLQCVRNQGATLVAARAGGPARGYPENALETFAHTLAQRPAVIEADVRASLDGVLVLHSDADLARTTNGAGPLAARSYGELQQLRLVDPSGAVTRFAIPTLAQTLAWTRDRGLIFLDARGGAAPRAVADMISQAGAQGYAGLIVYSVEDALTVAQVDPGIMVSVPVDGARTLARLRAEGVPAGRILARVDALGEDPRAWFDIAQQGAFVAFSTAGPLDSVIQQTRDQDRYRRIADTRADVIITDRAATAMAALGSRQDTAGAVSACSGGARAAGARGPVREQSLAPPG